MCIIYIYMYTYGQIIATSHDLTSISVAEVSGNPRLFQGNLGWSNIRIWPEIFHFYTWIIHGS